MIDPALRTMFQQVSARAKETARQAAKSAGVWPEDAAFGSFKAAQGKLGHQLRLELVAGVVGDQDAVPLGPGPNPIFGHHAQRFRFHLPYVLAAGYELGSALALLVGASADRAREAGHTCAVFNLAGSLFDAIYDDYPKLARELTPAFDANVLTAVLAGNAAAARELERHAHAAASLEVRLTLKTLAWSLARIAAVTTPALAAAIASAFAAELHSMPSRTHSEAELVAAARDKCLTLISAFRAIVVATAEPRHPTAAGAVDELTSAIGTAFWLIDDLVDIPADAWAGSLNALNVRAGGLPARKPDRAAIPAVMKRLLAADFIERAGDDLRASLVRVADSLSSGAFPAAPAAQVRAAVSAYVRLSVGSAPQAN